MRFPPPVRCFLILGEARYKAKPKSVFVKGDFRMLSEFKAFVMRGNVLDLAIAVIIGGPFATITKSLTDDVIMPVVAWMFGGFDFSSYFIRLGPIPASYPVPPPNYNALKEPGVPLFGHGYVITLPTHFLTRAYLIFLLVRYSHKN